MREALYGCLYEIWENRGSVEGGREKTENGSLGSAITLDKGIYAGDENVSQLEKPAEAVTHF